MIEKSLLLKKFSFATPSPNLEAIFKAYLVTNSLLKIITERWNQADLSYLNFYFNKAYGKGVIVLVEKDIYYKNVMLFIQHLQSFIIFWDTIFMKANIAIFFQSLALKWYISELSNFNYNILNNNLGMKSWVNTLFHCFKVLTSMVFGLFTNEIFFLNNAPA